MYQKEDSTRTITDWNKLPHKVTAAESLEEFRGSLHARPTTILFQSYLCTKFLPLPCCSLAEPKTFRQDPGSCNEKKKKGLICLDPHLKGEVGAPWNWFKPWQSSRKRQTRRIFTPTFDFVRMHFPAGDSNYAESTFGFRHKRSEDPH